ncbi:hypothetical protein COCNU_14G008480 [Cocos nucifera]|uniref:Uncharacterized protein n=1 Tax=Cocos nucifera TaxID=13894 RepID=A0A8K0ND86_COCNU|nr:hypothetical protein COCNU_14G008480 [Cocos nucifera]
MRVSNEIGAGNTGKAKNAVAVTLKLSVFLALTVGLLLVFGHDIWASFFSSSYAITRKFAYMTSLLTVSIVLDSAQGALSGVSRDCGWQHLVAFYIIGMPLALLVGFKLGFRDKLDMISRFAVEFKMFKASEVRFLGAGIVDGFDLWSLLSGFHPHSDHSAH